MSDLLQMVQEEMSRLDAEVHRLREELAALREITDEKVERVADAMIAASPDRQHITENEREWYIRDARVALETAVGDKR